MLSRFYKILPGFLQNFAVGFHRHLRLLAYKFSKNKKSEQCSGINKNVLEGFNKSRKYGPLKHICYAPYTSMFFSRSGLISPCYASYNEKSSHISQKSIREIWFRGSFKDIRDQHSVCNMHDSCAFCEEILNSHSYGSLLINKYEHYAFSKSEYPVIMEFELSNKCNLSCIMCDSNLSTGISGVGCETDSGNLHYDKKYFDQLREFIPHLQLAEFTGGDPFMIEEYYQIWDMITELNPKCQILITTNANTMNPRIEKLLDSYTNINFNISIDSLEKENYEKIRHNGSFDFALKNINRFIDYSRKNKTHLNILVCPMTVNSYELANFVSFANEKQICVYYHTVIKPKELSLKYSDKLELLKLIGDLESNHFPCKTKKQKTNAENFESLINLLKTWQTEQEILENSDSNSALKFSIEESKSVLREKVLTSSPQLYDKIDKLISEVSILENAEYVFNRLCSVKDEVFFEYLATKNIQELVDICKNFNTEVL